MPRTICLVSCVKKKLRGPKKAKELYNSDWFVKARRYVEKRRCRWFILSAKYWVLNPNEKIRSYNETLNSMPRQERKHWSARVLSKLRKKCRRGDDVIIFAGKRYRDDVVPALRAWGCKVSVPLRKKGIGQQLSWFNRELNRME